MSVNTIDKAGSLGALVAALAASLCCILPVVAVVLGVGAFGAASLFETLRPYLLGFAILALGFSFYQAYFRREKCAEGEACATKPVSRANRMMVWFALAGVLAIGAFPYYSGYVLAAVDRQPADAQQPDTTPAPALTEAENLKRKTIVIGVKGMTCEDCAAHLNTALKRIKGVITANASYPNKNVTVTYDTDQVTIERIRQGITDAGYDPV